MSLCKKKAIDKVIVWGKQETLNVLEDSLWLEKICPPEFDHGWLSRIYWQRIKLKQADITECDILFVPGGTHSGNFRLVVMINQNLLPFEWVGMFRYGWSIMTLRFLLLR